jgi:hypothetical protein
LAFRDRMKAAKDTDRATLQLKKPRKFSGEDQTWFDKFYVAGTQRETDRLTFSRPPA